MADATKLLDRPATRVVLLAAVLGTAALVRLAPWPWVFGREEVRFTADGDTLYHVLQAERLLEQGLPAIWRDPRLNHPIGADVPWPPLFDAVIAGAGWLAAGGEIPRRPTLEAAAALVPLVLGVLAVLLVAWLGRALFGGRAWLDAALVLALLPSHAIVASLGRPDQHALEPLCLGLVVFASARIAAGGRVAPAALLSLAVALSFWNWNGSVLYVALVAAFAAAAHVAGPARDAAIGRTAAWLAGGLGAGALLLAGSVALLGPAGALAEGRLSGLSGLQPTLVAGSAAACAAIAGARRLRPAAQIPERVATACLALVIPAALLAALPWTRDGIARGVAMLAARGWYWAISEFHPLLPSGFSPIADDARALLANNGLAPLAVLAAFPVAWRRLRAAPPAERGPLLLFGTLAMGSLVLGWARRRFGVYLSLTEALSTALVARQLSAWTASRFPARAAVATASGAALIAAVVAPVLPGLPGARWAPLATVRYAQVAPLARLAGSVVAPPGRAAVLAPWSYGHDILYWSARPVVSSPFGVEGGDGALAADAAFRFETDPRRAAELLAARGVGLVLVFEPLRDVMSLAPFAPPDAPRVATTDPSSSLNADVIVLPAFRMLIATRLWLWDGMWGDDDGRPLRDGPAALEGFRLLGESHQQSIWQTVGVPAFKLFQAVPGVRLRVSGACPRARVEARVALRTNTGRRVEWLTRDYAGDDGTASLGLPYAAGTNGEVQASPCLVTDGLGTASVAPTERDVVLGATAEVALGP